MESFKTASETISQTMQATATRSESTTPTPSLANFSGKAQRNKVYLANVMLLIKKTNNWANLPPLSEVDLGERAKDWQDELEIEVPLDRLPDALARARHNHATLFPIKFV